MVSYLREFSILAGTRPRWPGLLEAGPGDVRQLVLRYMKLLGVAEEPRIVLKGNLGSRWLGRCIWRASDPRVSTIEIQKRVLDDPKTLERVVAHEVVHHAVFMHEPPDTMARLLGRTADGHGAPFLKRAAVINAAMGADFVTVKSDESYVEKLDREYLLLIRELPDKRITYAWAARLSPQGKEEVERVVAEGGRLIKTRDPQWLEGAKIQKWGKVSVPKPGTDRERELRRLFTQ